MLKLLVKGMKKAVVEKVGIGVASMRYSVINHSIRTFQFCNDLDSLLLFVANLPQNVC